MPVPKRGDKVWVQGLSQPNGEIIHIDYHDKEVIVESYDTKEHTTLEWEQLENATYNERLNQFLVYET